MQWLIKSNVDSIYSKTGIRYNINNIIYNILYTLYYIIYFCSSNFLSRTYLFQVDISFVDIRYKLPCSLSSLSFYQKSLLGSYITFIFFGFFKVALMNGNNFIFNISKYINISIIYQNRLSNFRRVKNNGIDFFFKFLFDSLRRWHEMTAIMFEKIQDSILSE